MTVKLTHAEACKLVEDSLERVLKTLAYIRLRLERCPHDSIIPWIQGEQNAIEEANLLCNINWYGAYLTGAIKMAMALKEWDLLDFPSKKIGSGNYKGTVKRPDKIVVKSIFDLFTENTRNLEWCLHGLPEGVEIRTQLEKNKRGKIIGAKSKFIKKEIKYKEI